MSAPEPKRSLNFIEEIVEADNRSGRWGVGPDGAPRVQTRFPPEPNGYLHVGHAKSICLNYGLAARYGGKFNLRFDDTNPVKEEQEYVDSIIADVKWLGARWPGMRDDDPTAGVLFASDYFQQMHDWAVELIRKGKAYVCDQTPEQVREYRGTLTRPGRNSPFRDRPIEENLDLFARMARGEFPDGSRTLRARIDMASPNLNLRDPVLYRILHSAHHRSGDRWCIYPMYDWAHGFEDSIEGITHSICTLEFENHRPLYDWFIDAVNEGRTDDGGGPWGRKIHHPQQIEFARLSLTYTVMSKRKLLSLVKDGHVRGWDDPRMPTLSGMRRRGFTPEALREFCERIGVAKVNAVSEVQLLEHCVRDHLNRTAPRAMAVLNPLRLVIENWPRAGGDEGGRDTSDEATERRSDEGGSDTSDEATERRSDGGGSGGSDGATERRSDGGGRSTRDGATERRSDEGGRDTGDEATERRSDEGGSGTSDEGEHRRPAGAADARAGRVDWLEAVNNPEDESAGRRQVPFSGVLYIEREDFAENPPPKYWRLYPGNEVRLRWAYLIRCTGVVKDARGEIVEVRCTYDPATRGGDAPDGRKVKSTIHWVSAAHAAPAEVRLYDHLFSKPDPEDMSEFQARADAAEDAAPRAAGGPQVEPWLANLNRDSLRTIAARVEPSVRDAAPGARYQFERHGYFCVDPDSRPGALVFNRTVSLKDSWAKEQKR